MTQDGTIRCIIHHNSRHYPFARFQHALRTAQRDMMMKALETVRSSRQPVAVGPFHWYRRPGPFGDTEITLELPVRVILHRHVEEFMPTLIPLSFGTWVDSAQKFSFWRRLRFLFTGKLLT